MRLCSAGVVLALVAAAWAVNASGALPSWIRNVEAGTEIERAFFRAMPLPSGSVLFRRPPAETRPAIGELIQQEPANAELYSLRALEDEQQLDFTAAESDWKLFVDKSANKADAQLALADFYHRRLRPNDEIAVLSTIASAAPNASENFTPASEQRSWRAYERIFGIIHSQGLQKDVSIAKYRAWIARYPKEPQLYSRFLEYLIDQNEYDAANQLIAGYEKQFPGDEIFQVKAKALVEYRQGSIEQGLAIYERSFQPLWDPELVKGYFDLLGKTQNLRKFLDASRAALNANPQDIKATARIFYYYQQQGKLDAAEQAITTLRLRKESVKSDWTPEDLYICGRLLEDIHSYPEAARYYFALYNSEGAKDSQERALSRLTDVLLTAPETPIRLGTGGLSMYKDIATLDQGPSYLNGILSLLLNTTSPQSEYSQEEQRAVSYFHRARAAELLALLDKNFPNAPSRPELHEKLLDFYSDNAQSEAVLKGGKEFLAAFPNATGRTTVALLMADADARLDKTQDEFAIYDSILQELAAKSYRMPLGLRAAGDDENTSLADPYAHETNEGGAGAGSADSDAYGAGNTQPQQNEPSAAFQVNSEQDRVESGPRSAEYSRVLERYLARHVELKQIPQALGVLRREIDHNPDDPGLYERLAVFLEQNRLGTEQEEIYRRAIARFPDRSWYHKLARYYLRYKKNAEFETLTEQAVKEFDGSDLQNYFQSVVGGTPQMYLRLNQYANARFPHNPYFVRNLLSAYRNRSSWDQAAWEALLRQHWFEEADLRNEFFEHLSSSGKLEAELSAIEQGSPSREKGTWSEFVHNNPAAGEYFAQANLWRSHYEESAPAFEALANEYPADAETGNTASSVFRSLAYFDPVKTGVAVKIEENLLAANPGNTEILARIGDIYSDRELFSKAAPYWERIPKVAPGEAGRYLEAASIYWDYYDFDNALRVIGEGRKKLRDENLYGYEVGAIYEGQRDYPHAIHEYANAALEADGDSPALNRLLELARQPQFSDIVIHETGSLASASKGDAMPAIRLRVRVLDAEDRKPEIVEILDAAVDAATTIEQAAEIETLVQQHSLENVRQHSLEKQASLATDPVTRLQLRYSLVRLNESRKDFASAQRNIEALYRDNPRILGVVRATVDFYWRMKLYPQAIAVLQQAAKDAYPELGKQFAFEAARKSTEAHLFQQARSLLEPLLKDSPYNGEYLAAMADTYAQAGDEQGLKQFYLDEISLLRNAPLASDDLKNRIATLRRGLIPALTKLDDYSGAVDQYIEVMNSFPDDEGLVTEAALYSLRYKRQTQLLDYYSRTISQSPRDFRWPMVLARIQTNLEDFSSAIDSYGKAIAIRPDRTDFRIARATLADRLMRFDDAVKDYEQIFQLAYKDPKWMEKIAELRAREGRNDEAVTALKTALVDAGPERAENYFEVARRLESWGILEQARAFAEQGVKLAGSDLLAEPQYHDGAKLYARIMTRLRRQEKAYETLRTALSAASSSLPVVKEQVAKEGIAGITDKEWREHTLQLRKDNAKIGMQGAMAEMGAAVARYFTPEEKVSFAEFAETLRAPMNFEDANLIAIPLVHAAGLAEEEARWRYELMMDAPVNSQVLRGQMFSFIELQRQRVKFAELGPQLERFAPRVAPHQQAGVLMAAAEAYRAAGDSENDLRVLASVPTNYLGGDVQKRFLELLLEKNPQQLVKSASAWNTFGEQAADFAVKSGDAELAHAVIAARASSRPAVWEKSYTALAGLYFSETSPAISAAFLDALGDQTIGERLGKPVDRSKQLAGDIWFYYGSRYGEYLGDTKQGTPDDFLPAILEQSPASSSGYQTLADYYAESGDARAAIEDYKHASELSPEQADIHARLAEAYFRNGEPAEALAEWKLVFGTLLKQANSSQFPESFWSAFGSACDHTSSRHLFGAVKPDVDALVRAYLRRNGNFRSNAISHSAYVAMGDPAAATSWLLELSSAASDPIAVLSDIVDMPWIPPAQRGLIYQRILEKKRSDLANLDGAEKESALSDLRSWQIRWIRYLIDTKQFRQGGDAIVALRRDMPDADAAVLVPLELRVAAQLGSFDEKIAGYRSEPETAPSADALRTAAQQLLEAGDKHSARKVLEFVFAREIDEHKFVAANFLGLAEIRIADGDVPGALELLRRLVVVVCDPYQNMDSAAALLEKTGHDAEAIAFLDPLAKSTPWEPAFRVRLAKAQIKAGTNANGAQGSLAKVAADSKNSYSQRVEAVLALSGAPQATDLGSAELKLLAGRSKNISAVASDQPFFYDARLKAAQNSSDAHLRMQILSNALADTPARDDARIPLFEAAASLHSDAFALAAIDELLRGQPVRSVTHGYGSDEDADLDSDVGSNAEYDEAPSTFARATPLPEQQAQLERPVGVVLMRLHRFTEAVAYFESARKLERNPARRKELAAEIRDMRAQLKREQLNAAKQPILHADLEQERLVRPRLAAISAPLKTTAPSSGDKP
ncbi:MAG: tetratricopeptide repeat protein [Candidatus Acidiferrales bacterium]|jgi:predicted Zn-dependent protease